MMTSINDAMLTGAMGLAWDTIRAGERIIASAESWELHERNLERAGVVERAVWRVGHAILAAGEGLERAVNALAVRLGYDDGEVSGMVASPALAI